ncbi:MAG: hypothetical protein R3B72_01125 [Polyangiaceae bacterium]
MKTRMMALVALTFGLAALTTACGGNDCEDAADRVAAKADECGLMTTDGSSDGAEVECTEELGKAAQCQAGCFEAAPCAAFDGSDVDAALAFTECLGGC